MSRARGALAEDRAADYLRSQGYTLVTRRWKGPGGELDVVALDGETLVFVEVKRRRTLSDAERSLGDGKVARLFKTGERYAYEHGLEDRPRRHDLIAIGEDGLSHLKDVMRG